MPTANEVLTKRIVDRISVQTADGIDNQEGWKLRKMGLQVTFTGKLANSRFVKQTERYMYGSDDDTALGLDRSVVAALSSSSGAGFSAPVPTTARTAPQQSSRRNFEPMSRPDLCGNPKCDKVASVPLELKYIRRLRDGREWIGCESHESCGSRNFWFHLNEECAGVQPRELGKKDAWWCPECRAEQPGASQETGRERNGKV